VPALANGFVFHVGLLKVPDEEVLVNVFVGGDGFTMAGVEHKPALECSLCLVVSLGVGDRLRR